MSATDEKLSLAVADLAATHMRDLLGDCAEQWEIAGSVRRRTAWVGDIEHVVVPAFGSVPSGGLFGGAQRGNLLWHRLDEMLATGEIDKAQRADGKTVWGERMRAFVFHGERHEIYTTTVEAFGYTLLIRTGPEDFSRAFVQRLRRHGYEARDGRLWPQGRNYAARAPKETDALRLAGLGWIEPARRCAQLIEDVR